MEQARLNNYPRELLRALEESIRKRGVEGTIQRLRIQGRPSLIKSLETTWHAYRKMGKPETALRMVTMAIVARNASQSTIERFIRRVGMTSEEKKQFRQHIRELRNKKEPEFEVKRLFR